MGIHQHLWRKDEPLYHLVATPGNYYDLPTGYYNYLNRFFFCFKFTADDTAGNRQQVTVPVRYEMKGFNSLLGSHYDHYYLDYTSFSAELPSEDVFTVDRGMYPKLILYSVDFLLTFKFVWTEVGECHGFPGPGVNHDHIYSFNPMREFAHGHTKHVDDSFDVFRRHHGKQYQNETEQEHRKNLFRQNMR